MTPARSARCRGSLLALACAAALCCASFAAAPAGYSKKLWRTQDGLPEQTVQAFAQTPDGYLWIGTTGGLLRFDGARFALFDHENTPALREDSVFSLMASRDGSLWVGTEGGGLARYRDGAFIAYGMKDGLSDDFVRSLYQDTRGTIWVGTDNGLLRFIDGRLRRVDGVGDVPQMAVHAITEDHLGRIWVGGSRLLMLDGDAVREYHLPEEGSHNRIKSILETKDGTVWIGTVSGLHRLRPGAKAFERVPQVAQTVRVMRQTSDGALWIGTIGEGIFKYQGGVFLPITAPSILPANTVLNIFEDRERNLWIGTQAGLLRFSRTPISITPLPQSADSDFGTIYHDPDGDLWVASTDLFRVRNGVASRYAFPGYPRLSVRNVFRDRAGSLWVGTDGDGVLHVADGRIAKYSTKEGLVNNFVRALMQARDGSIWIAADEGVSRWTPEGFANYQMKDGLSYFSTRCLLQDSDGGIWIGTDRGLSHLRGGKFVQDAATRALAQEKVWAMHEDADGGLWLGTRNNGLYRFKRGAVAHYTTAQGLASNAIYQILEDARQNFWLSGPNGVALFHRQDLDRVGDHRSPRLSMQLYDITDAVETAQIYGGRQPSGCLGPKGDVWFPSNVGPIHIVPEGGFLSPLPPVVVDQVVADGRSLPTDRPIVLPPGGARLEISYAPILLRSQDGIRFRYKLEGFDKNWVDAGSRRSAEYTNLPAGQYVFRVAVFQVNDPELVSEAVLRFAQQQHFYRTGWFTALCVLLAGAVFFAAYRFRVWRIKARFHAVLEERNRLAREMHDTVIQGCASVSALLEAVSSQSASDPELERQLLDIARAQASATIDEARQVIWNLRQNHAPNALLGASLARMSEQMTLESGIPVVCELVGKPLMLSQPILHELMMVVREAVHNSVHHAHPANVRIRACFERHSLTLEVSDDGVGFDPSSAPPADGRHYGLLGMRERTKAVGGKFNLSSLVGKGTAIRIQIPGKALAGQNAMLDA